MSDNMRAMLFMVASGIACRLLLAFGPTSITQPLRIYLDACWRTL